MEEDKPLVAEAEIEDDKASNNGAGSTASQSSEEFVKVNQDDASDDTATDTPHEVVEDLPPLKQAEQTEAGFGERIMSKIDTREPVEKGVTEHQSDPVVDLVYWRDVKKSAAVFSFLLLMLVSLTCCSVISVAAYAALSLLAVTVGVRLYRLVLQTLNGTQQPHPFQGLLDLDLSLSPERAEKYAGLVSSHMNCCVGTTRDLLLVKNTLSSLKFAVFLWLLTYIGACFNGLTLLIIAVILTFAVPPVYEKYQTQIDGYHGVAKEKIVDLYGKVMAKLPGKKEKTQ